MVEFEIKCEFIVVVTVWKRQTLNQQLGMLKEQKIGECVISQVFVFQNGNHVDVDGIISQRKRKKIQMDVAHIKSKIQTDVDTSSPRSRLVSSLYWTTNKAVFTYILLFLTMTSYLLHCTLITVSGLLMTRMHFAPATDVLWNREVMARGWIILEQIQWDGNTMDSLLHGTVMFHMIMAGTSRLADFHGSVNCGDTLHLSWTHLKTFGFQLC